ncbi:hypothetical protein BH23THE1_BH23THE1_25780 [soil metagenome]
MKQYSLLISVITIMSMMLSLNPSPTVLVYSQSGEGLQISPVVQWSFDIEGDFSYCVYEGVVALDSGNVPQPFCIVPFAGDPSFENMHSAVNDGIDTYELAQIETPAGLFKDGAPYSVCVAFTPSSPLEAGFNTVESCQTFTNTEGDHDEEPFINLEDGRLFSSN